MYTRMESANHGSYSNDINPNNNTNNSRSVHNRNKFNSLPNKFSTFPNSSFYPNRGVGFNNTVMNRLFEVPLDDLSLLFSSPVSGYGTKLHNLKIGRSSSKDV